MKPQTLEAFEKIPDSLLETVSEKRDTSDTSEGANTIEDEIFNTGNHTTAQDTSTDAPDTSQPPESSQTRKKISELAGNRAGELATDLMNYLLPACLYFIFKRAGYNVSKAQFKLNKDERELIVPAWQHALETVYLNFDNPWHVLFATIGIVYGSKMIYELPELKKAVNIDTELKKETEKNPDSKKPAFNIELVYNQRWNDLVEATRKNRKRGLEEAKKWLQKNKKDIELLEQVKKEAYA